MPVSLLELLQPIPSGGHSEISSPSIPEAYWYDEASDRIIVASISPNPNSIQVLANFVPGDRVLLDDIRSQLIFQQKDGFIRYRKDAGTYNTPDIRGQRLSWYRGQRPDKTLEEMHRNVRFGSNENPNNSSGLGVGQYVCRIFFWLKIVTPDNFSYTTAIIANSTTYGLLHALLRHGNQFSRPSSHGSVSDILGIVPVNVKRLINRIRQSNSSDLNDQFRDELMKVDDTLFIEVLKRQMQFHRLIQSVFSQQENYIGEGVNINGQLQVFWKLSPREVMVTALSEQLYLGNSNCDTKGRKRPIRKIITVFLMDMTDFERKRNGNWPITKNYAN